MSSPDSKIKLSLNKANLRSQVSASYALMGILPILGLWYLIWAYVDPDVLSQQNTVLILFIIISISVSGFLTLRGVVRALSDFREHLKAIVEDRILDTPLGADHPSDRPPKESLEDIVYGLIKHNSTLSDMFSDMEEVTWSKTRELTRLNLELQRQKDRHKAVEKELRKSNMQLSDALTKLKGLQECIIRHERLSALGQLASGIAHDINNALMPAIGYAELILQNTSSLDDKEATLKMVEDILQGAREASGIVTKLKTFYRHDAMLNFEPIEPKELLEEVMELTRPRWEEEEHAEGKNLIFKINADDAPRFNANRRLLKDALINIIMNAIDAIPEGGDILINAAKDEANILIEVKDSGAGMKQYVQEHCLEPFFSTKGKEATGMGLAIAYGTVRRHSGSLEIHSGPAKGTTVSIRIPLDIAKADEANAHESGPPPKIRPLNILVIDDDKKSRTTLEEMLKPYHHTVTMAETGKQGINKAKNGDYDLVLTDRAMPDISGDVVALEIHKAKPDCPIVMVTGFGYIMLEEHDIPNFVSAVVAKPIEIDELGWAIYKVTD